MLRRPSRLAWLTCSGIACLLGPVTAAWADGITLDAKSVASLNNGTVATQEESSPTTPFPNIFPSDSSGGSSYFGHIYSSNPSGTYQFGSRASGSGTYSIVGTATYVNDFTVATAGPYAYSFTIDAGALSVALPSGSNGSQYASLSLKVTESIDGGPDIVLFDYGSSFSLSTPGATPTFSESGATLNGAGPTTSAGAGDYTFGQYSTSVSLGSLAAGQTVKVTETLISTAIGSTVASCGSTKGDGALQVVIGSTDGGGVCGSALARIGDPPTVSAPLPAPTLALEVPEPASLALLGVGLAGVAMLRRARGRQALARFQ